MVINDLWKYYGDKLILPSFPPPLAQQTALGW